MMTSFLIKRIAFPFRVLLELAPQKTEKTTAEEEKRREEKKKKKREKRKKEEVEVEDGKSGAKEHRARASVGDNSDRTHKMGPGEYDWRGKITKQQKKSLHSNV